MIRRALVVLGTALVVATGVPGVAEARPGPIDEPVRPHHLGPDKSDWYCTYQYRYQDVTCVYSPGNGPTPQYLKDRYAKQQGRWMFSPSKLWDRLTFWN